MIDPSIKLGDGDWAVKENKLLGYRPLVTKFEPIEFDVTRNTIATEVDKDGIIRVVQPNIARIDYSEDAEGSLLLEPQSTNLCIYSEDLTNGVWSKTRTNILSNEVEFLNGNLSDIIIPDSNNNSHRCDLLLNVPTGTLHTFSVFAKPMGYNAISLTIGDTAIGGNYASFDLINGVTQFFGSVTSSKIEYLKDGWYRCSVTMQSLGNTGRCNIGINHIYNNNGAYIGDLTSGVAITGAQVEEQPYATSYIPTNGTTVTRNADTVSKTGLGNYINDNEGVVFVEFKTNAINKIHNIIELASGNVSNSVYIQINNSNQIRFEVLASGTTKRYIHNPIIDLTVFNKVALVYKKDNTATAYINGLSFNIPYAAGSNSPVVGLNSIYLGIYYGLLKYEGKIKQMKNYNRILTDQELITLTTL